jgi:hypothetical protein
MADDRSTQEMEAVIHGYLEGDCLTLAFALHWMCGWPVLGVAEEGGDDFLHFAAQGPDGRAWDALGPRTFERAADAYVERPSWERIDPYRFVSTSPDVDEDAVTTACLDAMSIFGSALDPHVTRRPAVSPNPLMREAT